jgi:transcriptional regulator with XRE-family HTH domain
MNTTPLQRARLERGLTLADVCKIDNYRTVDPGNLSRIERGIQYPKKRTLGFLLAVFDDVTAEQIIFPENFDS